MTTKAQSSKVKAQEKPEAEMLKSPARRMMSWGLGLGDCFEL
jgi:hypothetical protein